MIPEERVSTHPGEILSEEFLVPLGLSAEDLAGHIRRPVAEIEALIAGRSAVTPDLAWLLSMALGTSPQLWLNLQATHDLTRQRPAAKIPLLTR